MSDCIYIYMTLLSVSCQLMLKIFSFPVSDTEPENLNYGRGLTESTYALVRAK